MKTMFQKKIIEKSTKEIEREEKILIDRFDPKGVFDASLKLLNEISSKEINYATAHISCNCLTNANRAFAMIIKHAEMTKDPEKTMNNYLQEING
jgi:hypothetical protein